MADEAAKIVVSIEGEVAKLEAAIHEANAIVASGAANMQKTMKDNDPFKMFRQSRGDVFFAMQNISAGIQLAGAAMKVLSASGEEAVRALEQLPLGLGQFAQGVHSIVDEWTGFREETEKIDELLRDQNERSAKNERRVNADVSGRQKASDLDYENAILRETNELKKIGLETSRESWKIEQERKKNISEGMSESVAMQVGDAQLGVLAAKQQAAFQKMADTAADARIKAEEEADRWLEENRTRNAKAARDQRVRDNIEAAKREQDAIAEQISAAQSELSNVAGPGAFVSSVSTAYGAFRTGQADAATAAMNRQVDLQQKLVDLATEQKNLQSEIKFGLSVIGGPN